MAFSDFDKKIIEEIELPDGFQHMLDNCNVDAVDRDMIYQVLVQVYMQGQRGHA